MSPIIAIFLFLILPNFSIIENESRRACEGCSFVPSPAFMTGIFMLLATK